MIRVGYVAGEPNPYRAPHLQELARAVGIELTVIYAAATVQRRTWVIDVRDATILRGPRVRAMSLLHHDYPLTPQIWPMLERQRFDCVVIGGWSLMATQLAIAWCRFRDVPYLLVAENNLREPRPAWVRGVKRAVLRHVIPQAAGHLVTGRLAREHQLHYGARPDRIVLWPNTIDLAAYERRIGELRADRRTLRSTLGVGDDEIVVLQVGRFVREKALEETLEAVACARKLTDVPLRLVLVGDGPLELVLRVRARELDLPVVFTGLLQGDRLLGAYAAADIFVLFSRRETWGVVVNEAAAAGLPLVLTDRVGASADLLIDGENGMLVQPGDRKAQAVALAELAADAQLRARYGNRSRELVAPFSYAESVRELVTLIRRLVGEA